MTWRVRKLRELTLSRGSHPRGARHLAAASALVEIGGRLHAVADDEHHLATFTRRAGDPVALSRLFTGTLPAAKKPRKKKKPDLECLVAVHAIDGTAALLAFGSGSRPNRERGARLRLDADGGPRGRVERFDLSALYAPLRARFDELNIEGAFVVGDALHLLQRANEKSPVNACISYEASRLVAWIEGKGTVPRPRAIVEHDLGEVDGVRWGFTDGAALADGGWAFSAVAEDTDDAYADAPHRGSAIGFVSPRGKLVSIERVSRKWKVEGLAPDRGSRPGLADGSAFLLVTDADDPGQASCLLRATREGR